jgi:hypothetical protein
MFLNFNNIIIIKQKIAFSNEVIITRVVTTNGRKILVQKSKFTTKIFEIDRDGIIYTEKKPFTQSKYKIPFERIKDEEIYATLCDKGWLLMTIIFGLMTGIVMLANIADYAYWLTYLMLSLLGLFLFWKSKITYYVIDCNEDEELAFFENKPTRHEYEQFVEELKQTRKEYLLNSYIRRINYDKVEDPTYELSSLAQLKENGYITDEEFEQVKKEILNNVLPPEKEVSNMKTIGFN